MAMQQKIKPIRLTTFCKEAHLSPAYNIYRCPQCYHRVRMIILNHHKSPVYRHQLQGRYLFFNLRGCKHKTQHPQRLNRIQTKECVRLLYWRRCGCWVLCLHPLRLKNRYLPWSWCRYTGDLWWLSIIILTLW